MPIPIPDIDDRNFSQLIKETDSLIARYFPAYADIGPVDPAVALNELFCYLFDMTLYQQNRITPEARTNFASLLGIEPVHGRPPEEAVGQGLARLSAIDRAITVADIGLVLKKGSLDKQVCSKPVQRVCVLPCLSYDEPLRILVVQSGITNWEEKKRREELQGLYSFLRSRSPVGARYVIDHAPQITVDVSAEIHRRRDSTISSSRLAADILDRISAFIDPLTGGDSGAGWEFGRALTKGDLYGLIEGVEGVDYVKSLMIKRAGQPFYEASVDMLPAPEGGLFSLRKGGTGAADETGIKVS
ncbi:MAG: hypothetical protein FWH49_05390 [Clostridiales bacterium]|nr:hypothetical protein [Clostridiales bacterium]